MELTVRIKKEMTRDNGSEEPKFNVHQRKSLYDRYKARTVIWRGFPLYRNPKGLNSLHLLLTYTNYYYCITFAELSNKEVYFILFRSVFDQS